MYIDNDEMFEEVAVGEQRWEKERERRKAFASRHKLTKAENR